MTNFSGLGMRQYMRKYRLKPSATCLYAVCDEQVAKKLKKTRNEASNDMILKASMNKAEVREAMTVTGTRVTGTRTATIAKKAMKKSTMRIPSLSR